jgi:4-hydroxybenzoate polyprenyltransferase
MLGLNAPLPTSLRHTLQVARPGLWATQLWFYLVPLGGRHLLEEWTFWVGAIYVTFPLGYLLYGWNDYADYETDRINPRKGNYLFGAKLPREELQRLPLRIALVQTPFFLLFLWVIGPKFAWWVLAVMALNGAYNGLGFKGLPVLDVLNQAGYLLVFVLSSWLNQTPQLSTPVFFFGALFAMHSHLLNEIADIQPDREAGRRTTAVVIGVGACKLVIAALLLAESVIAAVWIDSPLVSAFLVAAAGGFALLYAIDRDRPLSEQQLRWALIAWNVVAIASMYWVWREAIFVSG